MKKLILGAVILINIFIFCSCANSTLTPSTDNTLITETGEKRTVHFSFESVEEFSNYYIVQQDYKNTTHDLSAEQVYEGTYSHKAWITGAYQESTALINNNHRAYPTIQFYKDEAGAIIAPCYITMYVWLDMELTEHNPENQWLSFATLTGDASDNWLPVVCVNLSYDGYVHLMHVPSQGKKEWIYQTTDLTFPQKEWVKLTIYYDNRTEGYIKVWQNDILVSHAKIDNGNGLLNQAHFGLYASPSIASGVVYNDNITITEVDGEI